MPLSFRLTSYNLLADAYATSKLYPTVDPELMCWSRRGPGIVERVVALAPHVAGLQEVEASAWLRLKAAFERHGWSGIFAPKGRGRPDGCAILYREDEWHFVDSRVLHFDDGEKGREASGHLALIANFESNVGPIRIATTHLRWQAPNTCAEAHIGYRQVRELLNICAAMPSTFATVICGDLNVPPESPVTELLRERGFGDAYSTAPQPTCNPHRRATRIDYIFSCTGLVATPEAIPDIVDDTMLPSSAEPSDHLPITARLAATA